MAKHNQLIYVSTDIETNGPHIAKNSILSLASAAYLEDKTHTHVALDDALEQGIAFCNILAEFKP